jgi:RNA polymerase sigma-70 factor (ECF subfamily)
VRHDEDLPDVTRARGGDRASFEALYRRHRPAVLAIARRITRDPSEAEDVTQEVFAALLPALPRFRGDARFRTWLHRIAVNRAIQHMRKRWPIPVASPEPHAESTTNPAERAQVRERLAGAVTGLLPGLREVVIARAVAGDSTSETAARLGLSTENVRIRLFRARRQLAVSLGDLLAA